MVKVAVIGAGIIGMSSALRIVESFPSSEFNVTIISEEFSPNTTGDGAAGLWGPYCSGGDDPQLYKKYLQETHDFLGELFNSDLAGKLGICKTSGYKAYPEHTAEAQWKDIVFGYRKLDESELKIFGKDYVCGYHYTTYIAECTKMLPYFMEKFKSLGGKVTCKKVHNINELTNDFDVIVNCTGINANELVNDQAVYPIRGQVFKVRAPWVKEFYITEGDEIIYIIPNTETVVLGGTAQKDNWSRRVDPKDSKEIWENCLRIMPSLKDAEILTEWVGLRPGRNQIRLEGIWEQNANNKQVLVIHNYGHAGSGITLFRGCANHVVEILKNQIPKLKKAHL